MIKDANYWVAQLSLIKHPEGGYYKETIRSSDEIISSVGGHIASLRSLYTSIYFLLTSDNFSAWHRIKSDELWHWHSGCSLSVFVIDQRGEFDIIKIGEDIENGDNLQAIVKAGSWFASSVESNNGFSLVSCTVIPGFSFEDFEMAKSNNLIAEFPQHKEIIKRYCRE